MMRISSSYDKVQDAGPPVPPIGFPKPGIVSCERKTVIVKDHRTGECVHLKCIVSDDIDRAYAIKKKIAKTSFGAVRLCVQLKRLANTQTPIGYEQQDGMHAEWESSDELVVLKQSSTKKMRTNGKDPSKEAAALMYVGDYHPHVLGSDVVLQDANYLYIVTKYCSGGDLYLRMQKSLGVRGHCRLSPNEIQARVWFRQLIQALGHLQIKGVCHLDISLENLLIDDHNSLQLVDFGLACRVPYNSACNIGCVSDIADGTQRRLIAAQNQGGDLTYLAPEVIDRVPFDGFACDLWSAGIVLFILLVDMAPFQWAHVSDLRFRQIAEGELKELLQSLKIALSDDACDLLQNMLWLDPRKRLTLEQVTKHPWFVGQLEAERVNES